MSLTASSSAALSLTRGSNGLVGPEMKAGPLSTDAMNKNDRDGHRKNPGAGAPAQ